MLGSPPTDQDLEIGSKLVPSQELSMLMFRAFSRCVEVLHGGGLCTYWSQLRRSTNARNCEKPSPRPAWSMSTETLSAYVVLEFVRGPKSLPKNCIQLGEYDCRDLTYSHIA